MQNTIRFNARSLAALLLAVAPLSVLSLGSCSSQAEADSATVLPVSTLTMTDSVAALNVPNATLPVEGLLCAGQLSPEQMDGLKALGFESFVSLRVATENGAGWEEAHAAETGANFTRMPVQGKAGVNEAGARELAALMATTKQPMVLYCGSSNRVGSLVALKAHHVESMPAEEALELGKSAGVTGMEAHLRSELGLDQ